MGATATFENEFLSRTNSGTVFPLSHETWTGLGELRARIDYPRFSPWIALVLPIGNERSTSTTTEVTASTWDIGFVPRTALGERLMTLRAKAVASGMRLLSEEEVLEEVRRRRGELENHETDLY